MLIFEILVVALGALWANRMRSVLTMLGVIIGVAAVITMVALGAGAEAAVQQQIESLGANLLTVRAGAGFWSGARDRGSRMRTEDAEALLEGVSTAAAVVPELSRNAAVEFRERKADLSIVGTWANYAEVNNWSLRAGRFLTEAEAEGRRRVAVLGGETAEEMYPAYVDPVGSQVRIRGIAFEVVGVMEERGSMGPFSRDNVVVVPLSTAQTRLFGTDELSSITVQVIDERFVTQAMAEIESVLRRQHRLRPGVDNDFNIRSATQFLSLIQETQQTFTFLLAGIAAVSLVVGGIGIMNIMLVSVTERTREIGIRKAIGATKLNIRLQFLIEAMTLSCLGGGLGIVAGWAASRTLADMAGWGMLVSPQAVGLAFGFAAAIGIVFGLYPAVRASRLDPIDALRYE